MSFHKSQVFFYLLSAFIIGVFITSFGLFEAKGLLVLLIIGLGIIGLSFKNRVGLMIGFFSLALFVGGWRFYSVNTAEDLDGLAGRNIKIIGYVSTEPEVDGSLQRFTFSFNGKKILVTTSSYPRYEFGDFIEAEGKLELPQNFTSSTGSGRVEFDYVAYLKKDGIRTTLFFPEIKNHDAKLDLGLLENFRLALYKNIFSIKNEFQEAINLSVPEPNASFINGILLGARQNIPDDLKDAFSKTGTTHILAISGYNIMIISEAVLLGLIWFFKRRIAFWISVIVIILFVILTGASASVVRAAIMGLLLSFAHGYGRLYDQKNSIILAGAAMVWFNPLVLVFDIGFQLSFAAVLGLIYIFPWLDYKLYKVSKLGGLKELILMTLSAQVAVAPLLIYYFGNFSLISLPTNVLILSFLPYAMLAGFVAG